MNPRKKYTNKS